MTRTHNTDGFSQVWLKALAAVTAVMLAACSGGQEDNSDVVKDTVDANQKDLPTYSVITVKEFKPFVLRDDRRNLTGLDIELMDAIAKDQNFAVEYTTVERAELLDRVASGEYDLAIAGISITPERESLVDFSAPYYVAKKSVITTNDKAIITDFAELNNHRVAVIAGGTSEKLIRTIVKNNDNVIPVSTSFNIVSKVLQDSADYGFGDYPVMAYIAKSMPENNLVVYTSTALPTESYGIAMAKNREDELANKVQLGLTNLKSSGVYQKIEYKWLGE